MKLLKSARLFIALAVFMAVAFAFSQQSVVAQTSKSSGQKSVVDPKCVAPGSKETKKYGSGGPGFDGSEGYLADAKTGVPNAVKSKLGFCSDQKVTIQSTYPNCSLGSTCYVIVTVETTRPCCKKEDLQKHNCSSPLKDQPKIKYIDTFSGKDFEISKCNPKLPSTLDATFSKAPEEGQDPSADLRSLADAEEKKLQAELEAEAEANRKRTVEIQETLKNLDKNNILDSNGKLTDETKSALDKLGINKDKAEANPEATKQLLEALAKGDVTTAEAAAIKGNLLSQSELASLVENTKGLSMDVIFAPPPAQTVAPTTDPVPPEGCTQVGGCTTISDPGAGQPPAEPPPASPFSKERPAVGPRSDDPVADVKDAANAWAVKLSEKGKPTDGDSFSKDMLGVWGVETNFKQSGCTGSYCGPFQIGLDNVYETHGRLGRSIDEMQSLADQGKLPQETVDRFRTAYEQGGAIMQAGGDPRNHFLYNTLLAVERHSDIASEVQQRFPESMEGYQVLRTSTHEVFQFVPTPMTRMFKEGMSDYAISSGGQLDYFLSNNRLPNSGSLMGAIYQMSSPDHAFAKYIRTGIAYGGETSVDALKTDALAFSSPYSYPPAAYTRTSPFNINPYSGYGYASDPYGYGYNASGLYGGYNSYGYGTNSYGYGNSYGGGSFSFASLFSSLFNRLFGRNTSVANPPRQISNVPNTLNGQPLPPVVTLLVQKNVVRAGDAINISWATVGTSTAVPCVLSRFAPAPKMILASGGDGTASVKTTYAQAETRFAFMLTCSGNDGSTIEKTVTVEVK